MGSVKTPDGINSVAGRIRRIRQVLNPHGTRELGWEDFANLAGVPLGTAKKWETRNQISHDSAVGLAGRLAGRGYPVTAEWIRKGTAPAPEWVKTGPGRQPETRSAEEPPVDGTADALALTMAPHKLAALIEESLRMSHLTGQARAQLLSSLVLQIASFLEERRLPHGDLMRYAQFLLDQGESDHTGEGKIR